MVAVSVYNDFLYRTIIVFSVYHYCLVRTIVVQCAGPVPEQDGAAVAGEGGGRAVPGRPRDGQTVAMLLPARVRVTTVGYLCLARLSLIL